MQPQNAFVENVTWAADELVQIAKAATDMPLKDRIALLKDICDRGGLGKQHTVNKRSVNLNGELHGVTVEDGRRLLKEVEELKEARRELSERIQAVASGPDGDVHAGETPA